MQKDSVVAPLSGSSGRLCDAHDVALLDLDGVVYVGPDAVPGAPEALADARRAGLHLAFVTNNAARPPQVVADHLTHLGIEAVPGEVITSAQAAARHLSERLPAGAQVLVLGTTGLEVALRERGLTPVDEDGDGVAAVVQGYSPDMNWRLLAEGSVAIRRGLPWIATNVDPTVPSPRGPLPGNGSLVAALRLATGSDPVVTGKPDPTMHRETLIRTGARRPIVVGDRLDTDIEGANAVGCPSLLVFSGVSGVRDLLEAPPALRPTHLGADVGALLVAHPSVTVEDGTATCGGWRATRSTDGTDGTVTIDLTRDDTERGDDMDAARVLCAAAWSGAARGAGAPV
ncbi:HAD-IIA family hydrolase, partial [Jatrophihabitans endophyticus]|uniref:HAD-IIA family hydrolase n=1 Tax=Jatrophihabitans endophyticus TaxID=1206085 RepID=UPI0019ED6BEF